LIQRETPRKNGISKIHQVEEDYVQGGDAAYHGSDPSLEEKIAPTSKVQLYVDRTRYYLPP